MSRRTLLALAVLTLGLAPAPPNCRAQETRKTTIEVTAESDGHFVREIFVRSGEENEAQVFFIQDGSGIQPGVIKLRSKLQEGGFLGVYLLELSPELRDHFGVSSDRGLMVSRVVDASPAARAGIRVGDILLRAESRDLDSIQALHETIQDKVGGETLALELLRDGEVQKLAPALESSADHLQPQALFEVRVEAGTEGPDYRFGWHCAEVECPRIMDDELLDNSMMRLRELLESGELGDELHSQDPALQKRIELLERRLKEVEKEIEEESERD